MDVIHVTAVVKPRAPMLVASMFNTKDAIREHVAVEALAGGYARGTHIDSLLTGIHLLYFGGRIRNDESAVKMARFAEVAIKNIIDRWRAKGRYGVSAGERDALMAYLTYSEDWWKRQGATTRALAVDAVRQYQEQARAGKEQQAATSA